MPRVGEWMTMWGAGRFWRARVGSGLLLAGLVGGGWGWGGAVAEGQFRNPRFPAPSEEVDPYRAQIRREADQAYQRGEFLKSAELATGILSVDPQDFVALHIRASARIEVAKQARNNKGVRDALGDARQALAIAGKKHAWLYIPYIHGLSTLAELEKRAEHADLALKIVTPLVESADTATADKAQLFYQRGLAYLVKGSWMAAAADFDQAIRLQSDHLAAHLRRSEAYAKGGSTERAKSSYDAAVTAFPREVVPRNDRGTYRYRTGDLEGALEDFARCVEMDPKMAMGYINRGICLSDLGQTEAAEADYGEALKRNGPAGLVLLFRGNARAAGGNLTGAIEDYTAALRVQPGAAAALEGRGMARFMQGKFAEAAADYQGAIKADPQFSYLRSWVGLALLRSGDDAGAKTVLEEVVGSKGMAPWAVSQAKYLLGEETAEQLVLATRSADSRVQGAQACEAHYFIGQKRLSEGDEAGAREAFERSREEKMPHLAAWRAANHALRAEGAGR